MAYDETAKKRYTQVGHLEALIKDAETNYAKKTEVQELSSRVDEIVSTGGEPNVINEIQVNGKKVDPQGKAVNITVPQNTGDLTNNSDFQTGTEVDEKIKAQISSVYKPAGSTAFKSLPTPEKSILGNVYNVTDAFTTDDKFIEGETSKSYPEGTNVVVVEVSGEYKYDVLSGIVDLSDYVKNEQMTEQLNGKLGKTESAASAAKLDTSTAGSTTKPVYFNNGIPVECTHKLEKDVPSDAVFTDTTYENATSVKAGLMSDTDKAKLDGIETATDDDIQEMIESVRAELAG